MKHTNNKPLQLLPFPIYPALHVQMWDPLVLLHTALASQLWELDEHSSTSVVRYKKTSINSIFTPFLSIQVIIKLQTETQQSINTFSETYKQQTIATFAISSISSFTCASVRSMSVTTDSIDITAMRVGWALVHVCGKIEKDIYSLYIYAFFYQFRWLLSYKQKHNRASTLSVN